MKKYRELLYCMLLPALMLPALESAARDTVEDEFNAIAQFIESPQPDSVMDHAYSATSMPLSDELDPADVLLRRTRTLLDEFNTDGHLDLLDTRLAELETENGTISYTDTTARLDFFTRAEAVSRKVAFSNPLLQFKDLVFLKRKYATWNHMCDQYFGYRQQAGGGIYILEDAFSDAPVLRDVLADAVLENGRFMGQKLDSGSFLSPALSYDGETIYFSHTHLSGSGLGDADSSFHIYKVNVDGTGLRQLTDGPVDDINPYPLPNGRLVFISSRRGGYGRCHTRKCPNFTLYSMNADGTDITVMSLHETNEWHPSVDNNGMIVYTRWDYVQRGDDQAHHPWTCYPDGRDPRAIHGNYHTNRYEIPYMEMHVRAVPDSHKYVATAAAHHGQSFGSLVLLDTQLEDDDAMSQLKILTPEALFPESTTDKDSDWKFATAWPLSERFYLCGYDPGGDGGSGNHALTLLDAETGLKTTIYHDASVPCFQPIPLVPRTVPPRIPHRVSSGKPLEPGEVFDPSSTNSIPDTGNVALINVNDSTLPFPDGTEITHLRIHEILQKTTYHHSDPIIGYALEDPAQRILGTVPVESDGSAYFTVPADTPILFQALDANGMAVQTMRSLTYVKPGETLTCAGCHEPRGKGSTAAASALALLRDPSDITPIPYDGANPFSFPLLVQPIFDDKCVTCHQHQSGGALDLTAGDYANNFAGWYTSYSNLMDYAVFPGAASTAGGYDNWNDPVSVPGEIGALGSLLYQLILSVDHQSVELTDDERRRITLWLDSNADFYGAYENASAQAAGDVVQPVDPRVLGYLSVTNTDYTEPAIPETSDSEIGNNDGLSDSGATLALSAPLSGGTASQPLSVGGTVAGGQALPTVEAGDDLISFVGASAPLSGGAALVEGTYAAEWTLLRGPAEPVFADSAAVQTSASFAEPGSYILRLTIQTGTGSVYDDLLVTVFEENEPPLVDAGSDADVSQGLFALEGEVFDETAAEVLWTQESGPASAVISNAASESAMAEFTEDGTYVFRLTADDGEHTVFDERTVRVGIEPSVGGIPSVSAGADLYAALSNGSAALEGSASDEDGPDPLTTVWSLVSGPDAVSFGDSNAPSTTVSFSQQGNYVLQLLADDGLNQAYDQMVLSVSPEAEGLERTGTVTWEYWSATGGKTVAALTALADYPDNPDEVRELTSIEGPDDIADYSGSRTRGYLLPPVSGTYTLAVAADDQAELWLSSDASSNNLSLAASVPDWVDAEDWYANAEQTVEVALDSGQIYYFELLYAQGKGGAHLSMGWQRPGEAAVEVIGSSYIAPADQTLQTGSVTREFWTGISGKTVSSLTDDSHYLDDPDESEELTTLEGTSAWGDNYGSRIRAYLIPPTTGDYTFWIASDDGSELRLSTDQTSGNAQRIAYTDLWTDSQEWDKYSSQQSAVVSLVADELYYLEVLQKDQTGGDCLAVAWEGPGITQSVIDGAYLSLYDDSSALPDSEGPVEIPGVSQLAVSAGSEQAVDEGAECILRGTVTADRDGSSLTTQWLQVGGPGSVSFTDAASLVTEASFSEPGDYLLELTASGGLASHSDRVQISVGELAEHDYLYPSPQDVAWSTDGALASAADIALNRVAVIDAASQEVVRTVCVEGSPRGMAWVSDSEFWVCEYDAGTIALIDAEEGTVERRVEVGPKPVDVKYDAARQRLVVSEHGLSEVWIVDEATGNVLAAVPVINEPMYLALGGGFALAANSEPAGDARDAGHGAAVSRIDLDTFEVSEIALPTGSTALRGITVSSDGSWGYVAHLLGRTYLPTTQLNDGWVFNNVVTVLDLSTDEVYASVPLDSPDLGAANLWGLAEADGRLWVCSAGGHELMELDLSEIHAHLASGSDVRESMHYDLQTLYDNGWITRYTVPGKGPRGLAASPDGGTLAAAVYFGGGVCLYDVSSPEAQCVEVGPAAPAHALRRGEELYSDSDGCFQRWLSCSSCHPAARADGLNWDLLNDGIGNPKNTLTHLFSTETAPSMVSGVRADVMTAITAGFKYIQFQQRSDQEMQDVFDYLASLGPERSPELNKEWMTPEALRGKAIFNDSSVGCASCHSGPYFTNQQQYDVGTGHAADIGPYDPVYDVPSLREAWRNAPYLHDGSAPTLRDVITTQNPDNLHGSTSHLTDTELDELVAYLEQISGISEWVNQAPVVDAGADQVIAFPSNSVTLAASAEDEGLPNSVLDAAWQLGSGPASVAFSDAADPDASAVFTEAGEYRLEFTASDGELITTNSLLVTVLAVADPDDTDLDLMGDAWEEHYFGGLDAANGGADEDWDQDGLSNRFEYIAGSDPTDAESGFYISVTGAEGQVAVLFQAPAAETTLASGTRYFTLQRADPSQLPLEWADVSGYAGITGADQFVEWSGGTEEAGVFRVLVYLDAE